MTPRHSHLAHRRFAAVVLVASLLATACGASSTAITETTAERAVESAAVTQAPVAGSVTPEPAATAVAGPPPVPTSPPGGHQFGVSIDEFIGDAERASGSVQPGSDATTIVWDDLIPEGETAADIFARFETRLEAVEVGSPESTALYREMQAEFDPEAVNTRLDGQKIWLAGFVAPLAYEDDIITEFLLVPSFGACIHVPPPPPNQTILVSVAKEDGLTLEDSWGAVWVEGTMTLVSTTTDLALTSYAITNATSGVYNNF